MAVAPQSLTDTNEAFPGASISGNLVFLVPVDQTAGGLLIMEESFSFEDSRLFFALE